MSETSVFESEYASKDFKNNYKGVNTQTHIYILDEPREAFKKIKNLLI